MKDIFSIVLSMSYQASIAIMIVLVVQWLFRLWNVPSKYGCIIGIFPFLRMVIPSFWKTTFSLIRKPNFISLYTQRSMNQVNEIYQSSYIETQNIQSHLLEGELWNILPWIWLFGIIGILGYSLIRLMQLKKKLDCNIWIRDNIYYVDEIPNALVWGIRNPKIYVYSQIPEKELEYVLLHENAHIQRKDPMIKFAAFLIVCIHWFNPLAWIAYRQLEHYMELSCDEVVLKKLDYWDYKEYAKTLFNRSVCGQRKNPLAFGESYIKQRIKNIVHYKKSTGIGVGLAIVILIGVGITLLTDPMTEMIQNEILESRGKNYYLVKGGEEREAYLRLLDNNQFLFCYDPWNSYLPYGGYQQVDNKLIAYTHDGRYHYVFEKVGTDTLKFIQQDSSKITVSETVQNIMDGDRFIHSTGY